MFLLPYLQLLPQLLPYCNYYPSCTLILLHAYLTSILILHSLLPLFKFYSTLTSVAPTDLICTTTLLQLIPYFYLYSTSPLTLIKIWPHFNSFFFTLVAILLTFAYSLYVSCTATPFELLSYFNSDLTWSLNLLELSLLLFVITCITCTYILLANWRNFNSYHTFTWTVPHLLP